MNDYYLLYVLGQAIRDKTELIAFLKEKDQRTHDQAATIQRHETQLVEFKQLMDRLCAPDEGGGN